MLEKCPVSQSLLIQGRFQLHTYWATLNSGTTFCRNPFWSRAGFNYLLYRPDDKRAVVLSQSLLIQGRFQLFCKVEWFIWIMQKLCRNPFWSRAGFNSNTRGSGAVKGVSLGRNPFWSRAGFNGVTNYSRRVPVLFMVAIPFDPGQVSTTNWWISGTRIFKEVAIPFDPGQVSTEQIFGSSHLPGERGKVAIPFDPGQVSTIM